MDKFLITGGTQVKGEVVISGAKNAALFAVQILAVKYPELVEKMAEDRRKMQAEVLAKGEKLAKVRSDNN